jgi:hypothetical protein
MFIGVAVVSSVQLGGYGVVAPNAMINVGLHR